MLPIYTYDLARMIHEERIAHATRRKPEWMYLEALAPRVSGRISLWVSVAHILRRMAARLDPAGASVTT
jgi:hypothetical protein